MAGNVPPPPASTSTMDDRNVRCGCGFAYNGYRFGQCPQCRATETGCFVLACFSCRHTYLHSERVEPCPECGSGETTVVCTPDPEGSTAEDGENRPRRRR